MAWEIVGTDRFRDWYDSLQDESAWRVNAAVDLLEEAGPTLGRPLVDTIKTSRFRNMKELRVSAQGDDLWVLFIFDPERRAVLLLGGNKTGDWSGWYERSVPEADALYDAYLEELRSQK